MNLFKVQIKPEPAVPDCCLSVDQCTATPDPGPCRAAFPMYYYDPKANSCQSFMYGGCRGNQNRYDSMDKCLKHCTSDGQDSLY